MSPQNAQELGISAQLYPWTGERLQLQGAAMHYLDVGPRDAEVVLMVHGNPSWSFYWRHLVTALSTTHRCIVPDHIGMGLSDKPGDDEYAYTLSQRIADLDALVTHLQLDRPLNLAVHDWGGMIGLGWAVGHADDVARLIITNTSAFVPSRTIRLPWQLKLARSPLGTALVQGLNTFAAGATRMCTVKPLAADVRRAYTAPYDSFANRIATLRFVQDIPLAPGDPAWDAVEHTDRNLTCLAGKPTQIHWGERDFVFHDGFLKEWRARLPDALVHSYDAGHYVLEDVSDAIIPRIRAHLRMPIG